jgi:hypothetical protein
MTDPSASLGACLDSLIGTDRPASGPTFEQRILGRAHELARIAPHRLEAFAAGFAYQGIPIPAGLVPYIKLPPPEPLTHRRARFAAAIAERMAAYGYFSDEDAARLGMTEAEIRDLKHDAWRCSGAERMAA